MANFATYNNNLTQEEKIKLLRQFSFEHRFEADGAESDNPSDTRVDPADFKQTVELISNSWNDELGMDNHENKAFQAEGSFIFNEAVVPKDDVVADFPQENTSGAQEEEGPGIEEILIETGERIWQESEKGFKVFGKELQFSFEALTELFTLYILGNNSSKEKPLSQAEAKKQEEKQKEARFKEASYSRQKANQAESKSRKQQEMLEESLRVTEGPLSEAEKSDLKLNTSLSVENLQNQSTFHALARKRQEMKKQVKEQQEEASIASTKPQGIMGQGELLKGGENRQHFTNFVG